MQTKTTTILIVEDQEGLRKMVSFALRKEGFEVLEAENPVDAARIIGDGLFDVDILVADVEMPNMTGDQFAREMRAMKPQLQIIFATGMPFEKGTGFAAVEHNVFVPKPYSPSEIVGAVKAMRSSTS